MKLKTYSNITKHVTLLDRDFIASGGQAAVYRKKNHAFKIYHDPAQMIHVDKIAELAKLQSDDVMKPLDIVYDMANQAVGYIMDYCPNTQPLCRLFTKAFKKRNNIKPEAIVSLVSQIQKTVTSIHQDNCLIVDLNDLNILVTDKFNQAIFIDVDSYQTATFPAGAIMERIRDPRVKNNQFSELSDWYSWGIICFNLYIGIHPFKGQHPNYKKQAWLQRMKDHASVLDPKVQLPAACEDFGVIPRPHLEWFKAIFQEGKRLIPPLLTQSAVIITHIKQAQVQHHNGDFIIKELLKFDEDILDVYPWLSSIYTLTNNGLYSNKHRLTTQKKQPDTQLLITDNQPVLVEYDKTEKHFQLTTANNYIAGQADAIFCKNNCLYTLFEDKLLEHKPINIDGKLRLLAKALSTCICQQTQVFDGLLIQQTIKRYVLMLPFDAGKLYKQVIPELNSYRLIDAAAQANIVIVIAEKAGRYDRLIFVFDKIFQRYSVRICEDISSLDINFTVLNNGICVLVTENNDIEFFADNHKVRKLSDTPLSADTKLFTHTNSVCYIDGNKIMKIRMK